MSPKLLKLRGFRGSCLSLILLIFTISFFTVPVPAQKYPIALGKKAALSPRNKSDYQAIVEQYAQAACISTAEHDYSANCTYNAPIANKLRNDLVFLAIAQSDEVFRDYRTKRRRWTDAFELLANFLEIGLTTATSITNGLRAKSVLSDVTTLLQGTHRAIDKDLRLLENQVLFNVMETNRAQIYGEILLNMNKPDSQYSYPMALMDIMRYCTAGTLDEALGDLATTTGQAKKEAQAKVVNSKNILLGTIPTQETLDLSDSARVIMDRLGEDAASANAGTRAKAQASLLNIVKAISDDQPLMKKINSVDALKSAFDSLTAEAGGAKDPKKMVELLGDVRFLVFSNKAGTETFLKKIIDNGN
jgi:hypothetical protein